MFHVSQLKKCLQPPAHPISYQDLELSKDLTYPERPIRILEEAERKPGIKWLSSTRSSGVIIPKRKQLGNDRTSSKPSIPIYSSRPNLGDEIPFKGGRFVTSCDFDVR